MSADESFRAALSAAGLSYGGPIHADGKLHRIKVDGDREKNSWYVLHAGPPAAAGFGCWKRGLKEKWCDARKENFTQAEWDSVRRRLKQAERERERSEKERQDKARETARWILNRSRPARMLHGYLSRKGVGVCGDLHENRGDLVVPLHDADGVLHSLQFIRDDGTKRFLSGGRVAGCFFVLNESDSGPMIICEGYATAASIVEATGNTVVAAMDCGNLLAVAQSLRAKWPEQTITIASDNDQFTKDNPGLVKATETAHAVHARLAVPLFKDISSKPTDFNDLHRLDGLPAVKAQIESATVPAAPTESDDQILARLAALPLLEYERVRDVEADRLGIKRVSILDKLVDAKRPKSEAENSEIQGRTITLDDPEPYPESVNGPDVLNEAAEVVSRFVALPGGGADAIALWAAHTHCFQLFLCSPRLNIKSPEKQCGKTTLRDVVAMLVPRPLATENITLAVLFRITDSARPVILGDEYDAWLGENEELRGLLNAGHRRGGQALRCEGEGNEVRAFNVFTPAVLAGIGSLPGTLHDRSIVIRLERAKPGEVRQRFDSRHTDRERELCQKLARWCADHAGQLEACDPVMPAGAFNRLADNWRPLFAIAEIAGGDWPTRAARAFAALNARAESDVEGLGVMLLADVWAAFIDSRASRLFSEDMVKALLRMTDRPWPEAHKGKPITETWLARRLRTFNIHSATLRVGDERKKGYELLDFQDAIDRYLPAPGVSKRDSVTNQAGVEKNCFSIRDKELACHASEPRKTIENIELSRCHASETAERPTPLRI